MPTPAGATPDAEGDDIGPRGGPIRRPAVRRGVAALTQRPTRTMETGSRDARLATAATSPWTRLSSLAVLPRAV